jgi:hypothetical protein
MTTKNLRTQMPTVTAWIDDLRAAFGAEHVNGCIRKGQQGIPGYFYATENGHTVGTPSRPIDPAKVIGGDQLVTGPFNPKNAQPCTSKR